MSVGENIKKIRESQSITLEKFAELTGISLTSCQGIESGQRALNSSEVQSICRVLGVTFEALVAAPPPPKEEASMVMPVDELRNLLGKMRE